MTHVITWLETIVATLPLPLLEVWGRFSYLVGIVLAVCAFGGFTFRIGDRWGFGRERQTWDFKAFLSLPLTFVLIIVTGYIGSFIVLVPGAQTFESLKDLVVLLAIVLFGYPALIAVPPAYMISDLIEGVPPTFVLSWAEGYFFWASFVWMAYQLIGRNPDFRRARTWRRYSLFVALVMLVDPVMWGFICSGQFSSAFSYRNISSALSFTLIVTWLIAPGAFLVVLPLARRFEWFWAERLATTLHQEVSANIRMRLDAYLVRSPDQDAERHEALVSLLRSQAIGSEGRAFLLDHTGVIIASSAPDDADGE